MLREVKIPNKGRSHDYPKLQLSYLLLLEYWRNSGHVIWKMMKNNMHIFNEEYGEMSFSILGRCVLGDHVKSKFEHTRRLYRILPAYWEIKVDILDEVSSSNSISWRHAIDIDGDEVRSTVFFFESTIRHIIINKYQSNKGITACFSNRSNALRNLTNVFTPLVFQTDIMTVVNDTFRRIKNDVEGFFLYPFMHIWPEAEHFAPRDDILQNVNIRNDEVDDDVNNSIVEEWGASWDNCAVGKFAVVRYEFDNGKGIKILKVDKINDSTDSKNDNSDVTVYDSFVGREWLCAIDNRVVECLSGTWSFHPSSSKEQFTVFNYSVIVYFDKFDRGNKLPASVIQAVRTCASNTVLFELGNN